MINSTLQGLSPLKPALRKVCNPQNSAIHLCCGQLSKLKIKYDDVKIDECININKILICAIIISVKQQLSPQKKLMKVLSIKDSTGVLLKGVQLFIGNEAWNEVEEYCRNREYVSICMQAKCTGIYRFQIKYTAHSIKQIKDFNILTSHMSNIIREYIQINSK